ncbi:MAG: hypothetical protein H5T68_13105 [Chloroflexi bacterium]|nr:hypothetical protein [Chloroflexota bacterium]
MDLLTLDELKALVRQNVGACASIFMPTHRAGAETRQDPIRFKNLLREAEEGLRALGLRSPQARGLLAPARGLLTDFAFWRHQSDGLALFVAVDLFRFYRLPLDFAELVVVGERCYVKPLLPLFMGDGHFFILALSQNQIRLLEGTRHSVDEIDLKGVPTSLVEALGHVDFEKQLQFHTQTQSPGTGERTAGFHGHDPADEAKGRVLRYFRQVNEGLGQVLRDERAPLVLAGVDYLLPLYKEANTYAHLLEGGITGNPEAFTPAELHGRAWEIVQPCFLEAKQAARAQYQELVGTGRTSTNVKEVVPAAYHGRVEVLFVALGIQQWGRFVPETNTVHLSAEPTPGDEDLLDFAAIQTILNSGTVYAVEPEKMPDGAPLAAIFRF